MDLPSGCEGATDLLHVGLLHILRGWRVRTEHTTTFKIARLVIPRMRSNTSSLGGCHAELVCGATLADGSNSWPGWRARLSHVA